METARLGKTGFAMDELVADGLIRSYGVSVETTDEALTALEHPGVATIQLICNVFRRKPLEQVLPAAKAAALADLYDRRIREHVHARW